MSPVLRPDTAGSTPLSPPPHGGGGEGAAIPAAPVPFDEAGRQVLLDQCQILDTAADPDFDDLTRLAAQILGTPIALISLVDHDRQWFKSRLGLEATETPRDVAFCAHAIMQPGEVLVVPDATLDPRFAGNPLVTGPMGIRFYAGAPLIVADGAALGTLCVIDKTPHTPSPAQLEALAALARQVVSQIQLRKQNFAIRAAQAERERFFTMPLDMLCVADNNGYFKLLNPAFSEALGYTTEELTTSSYFSFVHPDDVAATQVAMRQLADGQPLLHFENRYRCKNGDYRWLSWRCAPTPDGQLYASARDVTEQHESAQQLRLAEDLLKQFVKHAPAAIAMLDTEMRYIQVSDRWLTDYRLAERDLIGLSHYEVFPDIAMRWNEIHRRVMGGAIESCAEDPFPRAGGGTEWLQWEARPWYSAPGRIGGLIFFTQVITQRKETEAELRAVSGLQRAILDSAAHAIIATTPEGTITVFNAAAERLLGYSAEEMIGRQTPAIIHAPEEVVSRAAEFGAEIGIALEPGFEVFVAKTRRHLPNDHEWTYLHKDGHRIPVQLTVTALWDGPDRITGFLGVAVDITERKRIDGELRHSRERFELVTRGAVDGIWDWDVVTSADYFSDRWCELLGYTAAELQPHYQTWVDHLHPEDRPAALAALQAHLEQRAPYDLEYRMRLKSGAYRWFRASGQATWDADGKPLRMAGSITDITEPKRQEEKIQASLREKDALLQEIHHRVKNNLQVISSLLSLQSGYIQDGRTLDQFKECQGRIRSMALIHEKLYQSETLARVDLRDYLDSLARIVFSTYATQGNLRLELALEPLSTSIDTAVPLGLLVNELLTNAVKYAFPEGRTGVVRLTLRAGPEHDFTLIAEDDGIGLPEGFALNRAKTLGMRLVTMFVKQLHAELTTNSGPGRTTFTIHCPGALDTFS